MSDGWSRYKGILEREDKEFKKAIEVEVSTLLFSKFSSKYRILAGVGIITQSPIDFAIFQVMLSSLLMIVIHFTSFHFTLGMRSRYFSI